MRLLWVDLDRFRNLKKQRVQLHPRFNLLLGSNGQGKTNFLEAIGYLGTLRSFRSAGRSEMIRQGEDMCRVSGLIFSRDIEQSISFALSPKERVQYVDDRKITSPEKYLQSVNMIHFIPEDVNLVNGSPSWKRKVIDRAVFEVAPDYVAEYRRYLSALRNRNALLRRGHPSAEELTGWNRMLVSTGAVLIRRRWDLILAVNEKMTGLGKVLGLGEGLHLKYIPSFSFSRRNERGRSSSNWVDIDTMRNTRHAEIEELFLEGLERNPGKETKTGHTLLGPHRDGIQFFVGKNSSAAMDLARYGSQGQKRSAVLAFKLAVGAVLSDVHGEWPLVILDDVASELDERRREALGNLIRETKTQFFVSTTGLEYMFLPADEGKIWMVNEGALEPVS